MPRMLPFILIALISAVITIYRKIQRHSRFERISRANNCEATHKIPLKDPILGADLLKDSYDSVKRHKYLEHAENRFFEIGTTFESNMMGAMVINTIEPENIKTILSTKFEDYELGSRRKNAFVPLIGHGIFTSDGPQWKHSRHLLRPNFTREQVGDINVLGRHAKHLIDVIPRDGSVVDLQDLFFRYTMDTGTELLFGKSTLSLLSTGGDDTTGSRFGDAFSRSQETMSQNYCLGKLAYLRPNKQFKEDSKYIHGWVDRLVRKALDSYHEESEARSAASSRASSRRNSFVSDCSSVPEERYVFLHELAKQTDDPLQLRSELLNLLIAGRDSTASLLSNLWFEMARRPDVWAKLREEVDALGGGDFSVAQLKDMTYLHNCLNESLRLHPVVPVNSRTSLRDTILPLGGGPDGRSPVLVPAGTIVGYHLYAMHRRQDIYGHDANAFRPERWDAIRPGWAFLPFNGGPRACLGRQLALTEAAYATVRLMQEFQSVQSWDPEPWRESLHLTCCSLNGVKVVLMPVGGGV